MKLIIDIEKRQYEIIKYHVEHGEKDKSFEIIANGIPYEKITNEDIQNAIKQGYNDGYEMAKAKFEKLQSTCKDCDYYNPYCEQFTNKPRGDGYCAIARMTSEGMTYINCTDEWSCVDFCPRGDGECQK